MNTKTVISIVIAFGCISNHFVSQANTAASSMINENVVKQALQLELPITDKQIAEEARDFRWQAILKVKEEGNYGKALVINLQGLQKYPKSFILQDHFASLIGDYASMFDSPLKERMLQKSKDVYERLIHEVEGQPRRFYYSFMNEYYFRLAKYKEQYELGLQKVAEYWGTKEWEVFGIWGYYSQGVGAANYAKELLKQGKRELALEYAQKALVAWAQCFSYDNTYYNAYVHHGLALGILGHKEEMMKALKRGAQIIKNDLNYVEFKDVIDFIDESEKIIKN